MIAKCPKCNYKTEVDNDSSEKFCPDCGTKLETVLIQEESDSAETVEEKQDDDIVQKFMNTKVFGRITLAQFFISWFSCFLLCMFISTFLPFAKIMVFHPKGVSLFDAIDYNLQSGSVPLLIILPVLAAMCATIIPAAAIKVGKKKGVTEGRTKLFLILMGLSYLVVFIITICIVSKMGDLTYELEDIYDVRVDKAIGYYLMLIGGIGLGISNIILMSYAFLMKKGKLKLGGENSANNKTE